MTEFYNYIFDKMDRIGLDNTDNTEKTLSNHRHSNYVLSNYYEENALNRHVSFATQQPSVMFSGTARGKGINGRVIDVDSYLLLKQSNQRPLEKLQLHSRPFVTVPYLGRGACNPSLESQLQQGEMVSDKKSVNTIMENTFSEYSLFSNDEEMSSNAMDASRKVEELAMNGWVRGGVASRELSFQK